MIIELFAVFFFLVISVIYSRSGNNFPPGPLWMPIIGHLHLLGAEPHKTLSQWKSSYGRLLGVWFGSYRAVVINDTNLIKKALKMNAFSGRPDFNVLQRRRKDGIIKGLGFSDGPQWEEQRRFSIKILHKFGFGKPESKIQECIQTFLEGLTNKTGQPIEGESFFCMLTLNTLWGIVFSETFSESNPDALRAIHSIESFLDGTQYAFPIFVPWVAKIAPKLSGFQKTTESFPAAYNFLRNQIQAHDVGYIENKPRDYVDAYTDEVNGTTNSKSSFHSMNNILLDTLFDFLLAGQTSSTTLSWLCAYFIVYPQIQAKLQAEIDEIVGNDRQPSLDDRPNMHYTEAVLNELMRVSSIAPFAFFHSTTEDVEFEGFFIPKQTMIVPNIYGIHFDDAIWGDPQNFRPERFIDSNGVFKRNENLLPFSSGKRICIGENFAWDQLFLITTNFFQKFSVSSTGQLPNLNPKVGFTLSPKPFKMILSSRTQ